MNKIPVHVYAAAQTKYLADYPKRNSPFGNRFVPDFTDYLQSAYADWYDKQFLYAMGVQV